MTMSKQDYELIAERIYTFPGFVDKHGDTHRMTDVARTQLAEHFADGLRSTNGMFQRAKFIRACVTGAGIRRSILPRP